MELRLKNSGGFTMIELFVVSLILGILLAIGLPKYADFMSSQSLLGLHNAIVAKLREAPPLSMALRKPVEAVIDFDNEKVWLEVDGNIYGSKVPSQSNKNAVISGQANNATPGTPVVAGIAKFRFDYWRTCTPDTTNVSSSYTIHVGLKSNQASYAANSNVKSADFRSITIVQLTSRAAAYAVGCNGTAIAFGSPQWPACSNL